MMDFINRIFPSINSAYQVFISILDILIVAGLIYAILVIVKNNSKTLRILKGAVIVVFIDIIASYMQLRALQSITQNLISWGFLVFIIIFQPEIRVFLEKIGRTTMNQYTLASLNIKEEEIDEITKAVIDMSKTKTGALITFERNVSLKDYIDSGVKLDSKISTELLLTIFKKNTALHDGAIIIQEDQIACASTYFPPPSIDVLQSFGSRHRAAIGISEITDSITVVVSEETGAIRIVEAGKAHFIYQNEFKEKLIQYLTSHDDTYVEEVGDLDE
ncbi:MAG: diadenylate cyclase CdaA [Erysipelotrichales bacterium]